MRHTWAKLRGVTARVTQWSPEDRERTISAFLHELEQVVSVEVIEHIADHDEEKLQSLFVDWTKFRKTRTETQRVELLVASVAKSATPIPFTLANMEGDPDLAPQPDRSNVVPLKFAR